MGISGRIARAFLRSKLTPLVAIAALAVGLLGILAIPREEEPQISVPMIDVIAASPGASPREVENLLARPIEQREAVRAAREALAVAESRYGSGLTTYLNVLDTQRTLLSAEIAESRALADTMRRDIS